jgi:lysophospholipase L1-like esterase
MQESSAVARCGGLIRLFLAGLLAVVLASCEDSGGSSLSNNVGSNDPNVIVAMGDSITTGEELNAPSYPERLSDLLDKPVVNEGHGGDESAAGAAKVGRVLADNQPGYVLIMYGVNDILHGTSAGTTLDNLGAMVAAAKNNITVPLLATITPRYKGGGYFDPRHTHLNENIRALADDEGITLVDIEAEFDEDSSLLLDDGIHPNAAGTQIIAAAFNDALN